MITVGHRVTEHIKSNLIAYQMLQGERFSLDILSLVPKLAVDTGYRASLPINLVTDTEYNMLSLQRPPSAKHQDNRYTKMPLLIHVFKNEKQQQICLMPTSQTNLSLDGKHPFLFKLILIACSGMRL